MKVRISVSSRLQAFNNHGNHVMIFRVNHGGHAQLFTRHQDTEQLAVIQFHGLVGHVELHARYAFFLRQHWQLIAQNIFRRVGQDEVEAVVAVTLVFRFLVIILQNWVKACVILLLRSEGDNGGCSAGDGTSRTTLPFIPCW